MSKVVYDTDLIVLIQGSIYPPGVDTANSLGGSALCSVQAKFRAILPFFDSLLV